MRNRGLTLRLEQSVTRPRIFLAFFLNLFLGSDSGGEREMGRSNLCGVVDVASRLLCFVIIVFALFCSMCVYYDEPRVGSGRDARARYCGDVKSK
jgi:hypothetical protein